jgi:hypothetical protein
MKFVTISAAIVTNTSALPYSDIEDGAAVERLTSMVMPPPQPRAKSSVVRLM